MSHQRNAEEGGDCSLATLVGRPYNFLTLFFSVAAPKDE